METIGGPIAAETLLRQMQIAMKAGLKLNDVVVLCVMAMEACHDAEMGVVSDLSRAELAKRSGLTFHQVAKCLGNLVKAGAIARRQMEKRAGESSLTMLCGLAGELLALESMTDVPADLSAELRALLISRNAAFRLAVAEAWQSKSPLAPGAREAFDGADWEYRTIESTLRERSLTEMEALSSALMAQQQAADAEQRGLYTFECDDGSVTIDRNALIASKQTPACVDLAFVRGVTDRVRRSKPGVVTVGELPRLVSEIGYSRLLGFVSRHDAAKAESALVTTISRGGWSRPRGIKESFYTLIASSVSGLIHRGA